MKNWSRILIYTGIAVFIIALISSFFLGEIIGDPLEFRLLNKTQDTLCVSAADVDNQRDFPEIKIKNKLYVMVPPGAGLNLLRDYNVSYSAYINQYNLGEATAIEVLVDEKPKSVFMNNADKYKVISKDGKNIFTREITKEDIR